MNDFEDVKMYSFGIQHHAEDDTYSIQQIEDPCGDYVSVEDYDNLLEAYTKLYTMFWSMHNGS